MDQDRLALKDACLFFLVAQIGLTKSHLGNTVMKASVVSRVYGSRFFRWILILLGIIALACIGVAAWFAPGFLIRDAADSGNLGIIKVLLACNHRLVSAGDIFRQTPLHFAAASDQVEAAKLLLANGAYVEARTDLGATPLAMAAGAGNKDMIELLLANHADINGRGSNGFQQSVLFDVVLNHRRDMARFLIEHHADVNAPDYFGRTPLYIAVENDDKEIAELLLTNHADVNAKDKDGATPLREAVCGAFYNHDEAMVELLLTNRADVNAKDKRGATPLHLAVEYKMNGIVEMLRMHGGQE